jgi:hypothetical protein
VPVAAGLLSALVGNEMPIVRFFCDILWLREGGRSDGVIFLHCDGEVIGVVLWVLVPNQAMGLSEPLVRLVCAAGDDSGLVHQQLAHGVM